MSAGLKLSEQSWWSAADGAELDAIVMEFVSRARDHRSRCPRCQAEKRTGWPCPLVGEAWDAVEDWIGRRRLLSRAEWLRERQYERSAA